MVTPGETEEAAGGRGPAVPRAPAGTEGEEAAGGRGLPKPAPSPLATTAKSMLDRQRAVGFDELQRLAADGNKDAAAIVRKMRRGGMHGNGQRSEAEARKLYESIPQAERASVD
jgi:hypothetical protein